MTINEEKCHALIIDPCLSMHSLPTLKFVFCSIFCLILLQPDRALAQNNPAPPANVYPDTLEIEEPEFEFDFAADFGLSRIEDSDGEKRRYFASALMPEFYYGPYSGGLLLKLHLSTSNGTTREEDYDSANDYLSIIRFLQYSEKGEAGYYGRFGELEEATLGFGQFINLYQNSISLDEQKRGLEFDYNAGHFLIESIYSNVLEPEVFGLRGAVFPLAADPLSRYQQLAVGLSIAGDLSDQGTRVNEELPGAPFLLQDVIDAGVETGVGRDDGRIFMAGVDASLPVFVTESSAGLAYAELSKIFNYGFGVGVGTQGTWNFPDRHRLQAQIEQRLMGKKYLPNYFNPLYEVLRLQQVGIPVADGDDLEALNSKRNTLNAQSKIRFGSLVSMTWRWKRMVRVIWSFENSWNVKNSGWFHFDGRVKSRDLPVYIRLRFDILRSEALEDVAISGNNLNFFRFEGAYSVFRMLMLGLGFRNSYEPQFENGVPIGLKKRLRIEPKFILVIPPRG